MRLILSRKGFDSTAGGCPSPVLPDGSLCALPIPDARSTIPYKALKVSGINLGQLAGELTRGRCGAEHFAHLDPDLDRGLLKRKTGWRPLLGQTGAAQGHLRQQGVCPGDLFLFFGLFRPVEQVEGRWCFVKDSSPQHVLWGWLQIDTIRPVDQLKSGELPWVRYHPHLQYGPDSNNTLYLATKKLALNGEDTGLPGAGTFGTLHKDLILTAPQARLTSFWQVPACFYPQHEDMQLSYHLNPKRWSREGERCYLQSVARGQEFVLSGGREAEIAAWLRGLFAKR